ncbi:MAG: beta-phosphoglucomutase family hydrolase [Cyanobacteria bacterium SZAS-4]|nr:beta-phosphoglucomutase family hydrolase [Cyanobacteria bacterium SZAS-4]
MTKQANNVNTDSKVISPEKFDAVLFDMDGVVTRTASVHFTAWKKTFDSFLQARNGGKIQEFSQKDYLQYVDGKPREDGVRSFLKSREIALPEGDDNDTSTDQNNSVSGLARAKDAEFLRLIHTNGVEPYETTISLIKALRQAKIKTALVTASKNGAEILRVTKLENLFDATVTGVDAQELHLKGKPNPDVFLEAAKRLSVKPERAVVVEDAEAGVESGHEGHFGLVIGVARQNNAQALLKHGADVAVRDLAEISSTEQSASDIRGMALADLDVTEANWVVSYDKYDPAHELQRESLCSLGNGKFCTRGAYADAISDQVHYPGTYVAGAYNTVTLEVNNAPFEREELVNMPNWLCLNFKIEDGDWFSIDKVTISKFSQRLNLREGILYRDVHFTDEAGRETKLRERRFVHMHFSHIAGVELDITAINWSGIIAIRSSIDATILNGGDEIESRFQANKHLSTLNKFADGNRMVLKVITSNTKVAVAMGARHALFMRSEVDQNANNPDATNPYAHNSDAKNLEITPDTILEDEKISQEWNLQLKQSQSIKIQKTCSMYTSRDRGIYEPERTAMEAVDDALPFDELIQSQIDAWRSLWRQYDLFIETTEECSKLIPSLLLHLNSFHCLQTASPHTVDLDTGVPARGWSGEGYQGHVFWDDLFVFPFINLRMPNISAALLKYRYRRLGEARKIAKSMGAKGACFPWQSASDGKERTPNFWWMNSEKKWIKDYTHLEIHVNCAIAYNVWQYYQVTANDDFMYSYGSEILLEIARFFATISQYNDKREKYEIHHVIGPDEFHNGYPNFKEPGVNNDAYTNIMAAWTLEKALELLKKLPSDHRQHICCRLKISEDEMHLWQEVSTKMFVPVMDNGVIEQFEGYSKLEEFPRSNDDKENQETLQKLLRENFGYLNQYKISKQPDLLMLGFLFAECELEEILAKLGLPPESADLEKMAEYYIPRTANQSTLSRVALAWVLSRVQKQMKSEQKHQKSFSSFDENQIFYEALGSDYYDVASRGTTKSGIHMAAMAGTVDIVQRCYPGMTTRDDVLWFEPRLPSQLVRLSFAMQYRGQGLTVDLHHGQLKVQARHATAMPIKIGYNKEVFTLNSGDCKVFALGD